jgi:GNAT superfamily N-acetyltransferase
LCGAAQLLSLAAKMQIQRSKLSTDGNFRNFWNAALCYQKLKQLPLWPSYPEEKIKKEIQTGLHFSAFLPDGVLAGYFSFALSDELIWGEKERGDAIYIHRMCVNPDRKGNNLTASVLSWACGYALGAGRKLVRMDTWGDNLQLVNYYITRGFRHIGNRRLGAVPDLPPHYSNANLALFENTVDSP